MAIHVNFDCRPRILINRIALFLGKYLVYIVRERGSTWGEPTLTRIELKLHIFVSVFRSRSLLKSSTLNRTQIRTQNRHSSDYESFSGGASAQLNERFCGTFEVIIGSRSVARTQIPSSSTIISMDYSNDTVIHFLFPMQLLRQKPHHHFFTAT